MIQKKSFFTKERVIFAVICLILDIIIIIMANRFLAYSYLPAMMQSVVGNTWMMMMLFALICSIAGVAFSKSYDMARAYFLEAVILIVCGFWFGVSRDAVCTTDPTAAQLQLFTTAHICLTIAMVVFQIDIVLNHPLEVLFSGKAESSSTDISTLSRSQKIALADTLTQEIRNSRGSDDFLIEAKAKTAEPLPKRPKVESDEGQKQTAADKIEGISGDGAVMQRQNRRYAVNVDDGETMPAMPTREGSDKTPMLSKKGEKPAEKKPKAEPLRPVPAQVDKSAYKKSASPADKAEWDPVKVAMESENLDKQHRREKQQQGQKPENLSAMTEVISEEAIRSAAKTRKPSKSVTTTDETARTKKAAPKSKAAVPDGAKIRSAAVSGPSESRLTVEVVDKASSKKPQQVPKAGVADEKDKAEKSHAGGAKKVLSGKQDKASAKPESQKAATSSTAEQSAKQQKGTGSSYEHIDIGWADPKAFRRKRRKNYPVQETNNEK